MSVPVQVPVTLHTGNGVATVFAYQFLITLAADLLVVVNGVVKVKDVDYSVSGVGVGAGGDVTFISGAPPLNATIVLQRVITLKRDTDYQYAGDFKADTVNADIDRLWLAAQGIDAEVKRSIRVAPEATGVSLALPTPTAFTYLRWNALANALENVLLANVSLISLSVYAQTLLDAVNAPAARSVLDIQASTVPNTPAAGVTELDAQGAINGLESRKANIAAIQAQTYTAFTTAGTSTAYTLTPSPAITAYAAGQSFFVTFNAASGAAPTLAISGVATPPNLVKQLGDGTYANIAANDIPINHRSRVTLISATQALVEQMSKREYSSGNQTITSAGGLTLAHGLGAAPKKMTLWLRNLTTEFSFPVGTRLLIGVGVSDSTTDNHGLSLYANATNISIVFGGATSVFTTINPASGNGTGLTNANWALVIEAE